MPDLHRRAKEAARLVRDCEGLVRVVSHHDADGLSAATVLGRALRRLDKAFQVTIVPRLTAEAVETARRGDPDLWVFADMGSGDPELLSEIADRTVVVDHHVPAGDAAGDGEAGEAAGDAADPFAAHVNAHMHGIDGSYGACAASTAFLVATKLDEDNWDLFPAALAGIVGDRQARLGLAGLNADLAKEAQDRGVVSVDQGPRLAAGPLGRALSASTDPFLVGLTGDESASRDWLSDRGIDPDTTWEDLDDGERRRLVSQLVAKLLDQGCIPEMVREIVGPRFSCSWRGVGDADRLAELLSAAGRFELTGEALAWMLGLDEGRDKLEETAASYRKTVLEEAVRIAGDGARARESIQVIEVSRGTLTGTIASVAMNWFLDAGRATVSLHEDGGELKVSTRGTYPLIERGLDLAAACRRAAADVGGSGGGHRIAAGATVPSTERDAFLSALDDVVGDQMEAG